jgi:phosphinothricin acetyltransferase
MIRIATEDDAEEVLRIYAPVVRDQVTSLETVVPSVKEMRHRIRTTLTQFPWLVYQAERELHGFAYASAYRSRQAYKWSVEVSIYVDLAVRRQGRGRALYERLFEVLREQGYCAAIAGIVVPNDASQRMHEALGFRPAGIIPAVGYKHGAWRDVSWWIVRLRPPTEDEPAEPISFAQWRRLHFQGCRG